MVNIGPYAAPEQVLETSKPLTGRHGDVAGARGKSVVVGDTLRNSSSAGSQAHEGQRPEGKARHTIDQLAPSWSAISDLAGGRQRIGRGSIDRGRPAPTGPSKLCAMTGPPHSTLPPGPFPIEASFTLYPRQQSTTSPPIGTRPSAPPDLRRDQSGAGIELCIARDCG